MLSNALPLPSQLMRTSAALSRFVNSVLVNCDPWSLLKMYGVSLKGLLERFQTKRGFQGNRRSPGEYVATEPVNDGYQVQKPLRH